MEAFIFTAIVVEKLQACLGFGPVPRFDPFLSEQPDDPVFLRIDLPSPFPLGVRRVPAGLRPRGSKTGITVSMIPRSLKRTVVFLGRRSRAFPKSQWEFRYALASWCRRTCISERVQRLSKRHPLGRGRLPGCKGSTIDLRYKSQ